MSDNLEYIDEFARKSMNDYTMGATSNGWEKLDQSLDGSGFPAADTSFLSNLSDAFVQFFANKVYLVSSIIVVAGIGYGIFGTDNDEKENKNQTTTKEEAVIVNTPAEKTTNTNDATLTQENIELQSNEQKGNINQNKLSGEVDSEKERITEKQTNKIKRDTVKVHKNVVVKKKVVLRKKIFVKDTVPK